jgi:hypothetical protein
MAAKDLITLTYAKSNIQAITDTSQDTLIAQLVTTCSDAICRYCRRDFISRFYDELYNGNGDRRLLLREYPIQSVQSVRYRPVTVLKIIQNDTQTYQQARVIVNSTGLELTMMASGTYSTDTSSLYASFPTLNAIATNINTLTGWNAQIQGDAGPPSGPTGDYGLWPSADLYVPPPWFSAGELPSTPTSQGALSARGMFAELKMHTYELAGYQFDPRGWLLRAIPYTDPELLHPEDLVWPWGINNFRIQYTAGFPTILESIQQACAIWVSILWYATQRDPEVQSQEISGATTQTWRPNQPLDVGRPPQAILPLLQPYRRFTVATGQA